MKMTGLLQMKNAKRKRGGNSSSSLSPKTRVRAKGLSWSGAWRTLRIWKQRSPVKCARSS